MGIFGSSDSEETEQQKCKIGLIQIPTSAGQTPEQATAAEQIQQWAEEWLTSPADSGFFSSGETRCEIATNAYNCLITGTIGQNVSENEDGYLNSIQPFVEDRQRFIDFYNDFDQEVGFESAQDADNPTAETTYNKIISLFNLVLNDRDWETNG